MKSGLVFFSLLSLMGLFACSGSKKLPVIVDVVQDSTPIQSSDFKIANLVVVKEDVLQEILDSSLLNTGFTGIFIYDLENDSVLYKKSSQHYFVPASNTKILTLFACIHILGDSIPALRYAETDSTFTFWGTADPTFLHSFFPDSDVLSFLKSKVKNKTIYYSENQSTITAYGKGWMWDDYNDYYQPELTPWPMYGNVVTISKDPSGLTVSPQDAIELLIKDTSAIKVKRNFENNVFEFPTFLDSINSYYQEVPYKNASGLNIKLLQNILGKIIFKKEIPLPKEAKFKYSIMADTVYRRMMQVSDNMLAEHLLLQCGMTVADTLSTSFSIDTIMSKYAGIIDTSSVWVDGSGLSRYNLFTPETFVLVLRDLYKEVPEERLFSLMAIGGRKGSLKNMFNENSIPYVFAKPGSMAGVYNLSGYLITESGRKLAFCIMNNNFTCKVSSAKKVVTQIVEKIRNLY